MYSQIILILIIIAGGGWAAYHYLTTTFLQSSPASNKKEVNALFGWPMIQLVVALLAFFLLWAFLPENVDQLFISDFANWAYRYDIPIETIDGMFTMKKFFGYALIVSGGISVYLLLTLFNRKVTFDKISIIKNISCLNTVYTTYAAWYILSWLVVFILLDIFGEALYNFGASSLLVFLIVVEIAFAAWLIYIAVKLQKLFNRSLLPSDEVVLSMSSKKEETKKCPYCGETILMTAKKCKHCGEWLKEEDMRSDITRVEAPVSQSVTVEQTQTKTVRSKDTSVYGSKKLLIFGLGVVVVILLLLLFVRNYDSQKNQQSSGSNSASDSEYVDSEPASYIETEPSYEEYTID